MKYMRRIAVVLFIMVSGLLNAQSNNANTIKPKAVINYNADKAGSGTIIYDTSFFIWDANINESERQTVMAEMLKDPEFKKLNLDYANGVKDLLVILDVRAKNMKGLTAKLKKLLNALHVKEVEYNQSSMPVKNFSLN